MSRREHREAHAQWVRDRAATGVQTALKSLSTQLSGAQVGITLTTVLLGYTMQAALANLLTGLMSHWLATSVATGAAVVIALIVAGLLEVSSSKEKKGDSAAPLVQAAAALAVINVIVAIFWH